MPTDESAPSQVTVHDIFDPPKDLIWDFARDHAHDRGHDSYCKSRQELDPAKLVCTCGSWAEWEVAVRELHAELSRLVSAAKREGAIEALENIARSGCVDCSSDIKMVKRPRSIGTRHNWWHKGPHGFHPCERPEVWDALLKLRSKGGTGPDGGGRWARP